jgi:trigger factor
MQVQIEDVSPVEKKLSFEIPWEAVQEKLGDAYSELSKSVSLKGFRPGKVPRSVIQRMFGKRVRSEVAGQLVRESFLQAVEEHQLQVVSEPDVHDPELKSGEPFCFHAHVEVRAALDLAASDYDGLELTRHVIAVGDEQVQRALENLQREHTDLKKLEGRDITGRGDVIKIALKGTIGDEVIDRPEFTVDLEDSEQTGLPGLAEALTGIPTNVKDHPVKLELPDGDGKVDLKISIVEAWQKVVPELDDEFAKDTGRAETLEQLREVLREELRKRAAEEEQRQLRDSALKALVARNQIPVAEGLVNRAAGSQLQRLRAMLQAGPDQDLNLGDDLQARLKEGAADDVRGEFLLEAIAAKEGIEITDEAIDERIATLAKYQGKPAHRVKAELDRDGRLPEIQFSLRREKTLDLLVERATITDAKAEPGEAEGSDGAEGGEGQSTAKSFDAEPEKSVAKPTQPAASEEDKG